MATANTSRTSTRDLSKNACGRDDGFQAQGRGENFAVKLERAIIPFHLARSTVAQTVRQRNVRAADRGRWCDERDCFAAKERLKGAASCHSHIHGIHYSCVRELGPRYWKIATDHMTIVGDGRNRIKVELRKLRISAGRRSCRKRKSIFFADGHVQCGADASRENSTILNVEMCLEDV